MQNARAEQQPYTFFIFEPHFDKKYHPKMQTKIERLNSDHYATKYNKKQKRPTNFPSRFVAMPKHTDYGHPMKA